MAKIIGHGAPTSKTFGVLGQEYFDKDSNKVYTCTKVTHKTAYRAGEADAEYEWSVVGGGGDPYEVKKEPFITVTGADFKPNYILDEDGNPTEEFDGYVYEGSPALDWLTGVDSFDFYIELLDFETGEPIVFTKDVTEPWYYEIAEDGCWVYPDDFSFEIFSSIEKNAFIFFLYGVSPDMLSSFTNITLYKHTTKKLAKEALPDTVATKAYVEELIGGIENGSY